MSAPPQIVIDTREQRPFHILRAIARTLETGDYSVEDFETVIAIERKSLNDLLTCIGRERERFERELVRLSRMPYAAIVVEATLAEVLAGTRHTIIHPNSVLGSLCAWSMRNRLPIWFCGERDLAQQVTERLLLKAAKYASEQQR